MLSYYQPTRSVNRRILSTCIKPQSLAYSQYSTAVDYSWVKRVNKLNEKILHVARLWSIVVY